ncbi:unnamed protein product [Urochloa humidicola]
MLPWPVTWSPGRSSGIVAGFESNVPRIGPREDIVVLLSRMMLIPHIQASSLMEVLWYHGSSSLSSCQEDTIKIIDICQDFLRRC